MPFDHHALIAWIVDHEEREPGSPLDGSTLLERAPTIIDDSNRPQEELVQAAGKLRRLGWIDWQYKLWPHEESEPRSEFIDQNALSKASNIMATVEGLNAVAARRQAKMTTTQINIINSTVGQLALRDIQNVNISVVLDAIEQSLADIDAPPEAKQDAHGVIGRMREAVASVATTAASEVLATAVRRSLGLP